MRRRLALATLSLTTLSCLVVVAEGATPKAPGSAPSVAYKAGTAMATGTQPANKRVSYTGSPLRFAGATTPRGMGEPTVGVTTRGTVYTTTLVEEISDAHSWATSLQEAVPEIRSWLGLGAIA